MAAFDNGILITEGFAVAAKKPADLKYIAETIEERDSYSAKNIAYEGMLVFVNEDKQTYQFINDNWIEFGLAGFEFQAQVEDSLTSTSITKALSAKQGSVLNSAINIHKANNEQHITIAERNAWNAKADTRVATQTYNGLMSKDDKAKLDSIATGANKYDHPKTHDATMIIQDSTHRFVTDAQIANWSSDVSLASTSSDGLMSKEDKIKLDNIQENSLNIVTTTSDGLMSAIDKKKLDAIEANANNYVHPNNEGMRHVTDAEKKYWNEKANKDVASEVQKGLMSISDKVKLDEIEEKANNYIHPDTHPATMITDDAKHRFVTDRQIVIWDAKASTDVATDERNGLLSLIDKKKLDTIEANANNYIHPDTHNASMIVEDEEHRFASDEEKEYWNNKASTDIATQTDNGLMSKIDKSKLDAIEEGANNYIHPDTHPATMIMEDATHRFASDEEKEYWNNKASTDIATQTDNGLMSKEDKCKLDAIEEGANNYKHPESHFASMITQDATHKFVTNKQIEDWDKIGKIVNEKFIIASTVSDGLMSKEDKQKLNGIAINATNYEHPATHPASIIEQDTNRNFVSSAEKAYWNAKANTDIVKWQSDDIDTHCPGLMPPEAMIKLNKIEENANNYIHPDTHTATMIVQDPTHRFVTDEQIVQWNNKPVTKEDLGLSNVTNDTQVKRSEMGVANGVATLDINGLVPTSQLPSFVDEIMEYESAELFPETGESNKIYVDVQNNLKYRWSGTQYIEISSSIALGETSSTAYAGDKGKANAIAINNIINGTTIVPKATEAVNASKVNNLTVLAPVPADAKFTDTIYTHPDEHPASMIVQDSTHRFVTDEEKEYWNSENDLVSYENDGLMSISDKQKLDSIDPSANKYVHPNTHPATMIVQDGGHRFVTDEEKNTWNNRSSVVTDTNNGLMISSDKRKLDSIASNANNYVHPTTHAATMIMEDSTHRFVTDEERASWNAKASNTLANSITDGLMSRADKNSLDELLERVSNIEKFLHNNFSYNPPINEELNNNE